MTSTQHLESLLELQVTMQKIEFPFFPYLIIGATSIKDDVGYESFRMINQSINNRQSTIHTAAELNNKPASAHTRVLKVRISVLVLHTSIKAVKAYHLELEYYQQGRTNSCHWHLLFEWKFPWLKYVLLMLEYQLVKVICLLKVAVVQLGVRTGNTIVCVYCLELEYHYQGPLDHCLVRYSCSGWRTYS